MTKLSSILQTLLQHETKYHSITESSEGILEYLLQCVYISRVVLRIRFDAVSVYLFLTKIRVILQVPPRNVRIGNL